MKRLFLFIPVAFLFFVNSCADLPMGSLGDDLIATALAETQIAQTRAAAPTPTYDPNIPDMINWLNTDLSTSSPLGWTIDAEYHVTDISFPNAKNGSVLFRMDVGCICLNNNDCCLPERTFVVALEAMYRNRSKALLQVPSRVSEILVVCINRQTKAKIGAMTASWQDVDAYLRGQISGSQLGVRVARTDVP